MLFWLCSNPIFECVCVRTFIHICYHFKSLLKLLRELAQKRMKGKEQVREGVIRGRRRRDRREGEQAGRRPRLQADAGFRLFTVEWRPVGPTHILVLVSVPARRGSPR